MQDIDTIVMNHITHIVNTASPSLPNHFQNYGAVYLCFSFVDADKAIILDSLDKNISAVVKFVEEAKLEGESVLIHGSNSYTVSMVMFCAYLMVRYKWSMYKTVEFLESRMGRIEMGNGLIRQLRGYEGQTGAEIDDAVFGLENV